MKKTTKASNTSRASSHVPPELLMVIDMLRTAVRDARKGSDEARRWLHSDSRAFLSAHWCVDSIHRLCGSGPTLDTIRRRL